MEDKKQNNKNYKLQLNHKYEGYEDQYERKYEDYEPNVNNENMKNVKNEYNGNLIKNTLALQENKITEHRSNYKINKIDDNLKKRLFHISEETSYPPYDIEKLESNNHDFELYRVIIAVAGFKKEDLQIILNEDCLVIKGAARSSDRVLLHKGISSKSFEKIFQLADSMSIRHSFLRDGLLCIDIIRHIMRKNVQNIEIMTGSDVLVEM